MWKDLALALARAFSPLLPAPVARGINLALVLADIGSVAKDSMKSLIARLDAGDITNEEVDALMSKHGVNTERMEAVRARAEAI